VQNLTISSSGG